jgi:hypothetical protein
VYGSTGSCHHHRVAGRSGSRRHRRRPGIASPSPTMPGGSARGAQMLVGYLHTEDEETRRRRVLPHRRSRPLGRRLPGRHGPGQRRCHPQRREHLTQEIEDLLRAILASPRWRSSACPTADRRAGVRGDPRDGERPGVADLRGLEAMARRGSKCPNRWRSGMCPRTTRARS